jgi:hypothetical protein
MWQYVFLLMSYEPVILAGFGHESFKARELSQAFAQIGKLPMWYFDSDDPEVMERIGRLLRPDPVFFKTYSSMWNERMKEIDDD